MPKDKDNKPMTNAELAESESRNPPIPASERGPALSVPDEPGAITSDTAALDIGDPDMRRDLSERLRGWLPEGATLQHGGGALIKIFPEDIDDLRPGMFRVVTYKGHEVVEAEKANSDNDFVSLHFDVYDTNTGKLLGTGSFPLVATLMKYFKVEERTVESSDARKKSKKTYTVGRTPEETPMLVLTYTGRGGDKAGRNPAKHFMVEEIVPRAAKPGKK